MTVPTPTLADFLLARFAEDEEAARPLMDSTPDEDGAQPRWKWSLVDWNSELADEHGHRWSPARVLAECDAKRAVVVTYRSFVQASETTSNLQSKLTAAGAVAALEVTLKFLTLPYADHPDYRDEWRP